MARSQGTSNRGRGRRREARWFGRWKSAEKRPSVVSSKYLYSRELPFSGFWTRAARQDLLQSLAAACEFLLNGLDCGGPDKGFRVLVPGLEKGVNCRLQVGDA